MCQEYVLLSNSYVVNDYKHLYENVEQERKEKKQLVCCSWIETSNDMHTFVVKDENHHQMIEVCAKLQRLLRFMYIIRYVFCMKFVLQDVEERKLFICVNIMRNWLLHLGSSTQLLVFLSKFKKKCRFLKIATLPKS